MQNGKRTFVLNWPGGSSGPFVPIGCNACMILHFIGFYLDGCGRRTMTNDQCSIICFPFYFPDPPVFRSESVSAFLPYVAILYSGTSLTIVSNQHVFRHQQVSAACYSVLYCPATSLAGGHLKRLIRFVNTCVGHRRAASPSCV